MKKFSNKRTNGKRKTDGNSQAVKKLKSHNRNNEDDFNFDLSLDDSSSSDNEKSGEIESQSPI